MSVKIGVVISSTRPVRVGDKIANWYMEKVKNIEDVEFELIDLREENLPFLSEKHSPSTGQYEQATTKKWSEKIKTFDGFVFVTAEYNNAYPAPLKNAIDTLYHEWNHKPVGFVGYGTYGGVRAVEQLVNVTAKVGMMPLTKAMIGITSPWHSIKEDGSVDETFVHGNVEGMNENLIWWTTTLKNART